MNNRRRKEAYRVAVEKNMFISLILSVFRRSAAAFARFPITVIYFLAFLVTLTLNTFFAFSNFQTIESIAITFFAGAVLNMALVALKERSEKVDTIFSAISFLGFFTPFLFFLTLYLFPLNVLWLFRSFAVGIILFLIFMIIPGYKRTVFEFDKMIIVIVKAVITGIIFSGFLFAGIAILIYSVKNFFITNLSDNSLIYSVYFCLFVFLIFFLGAIPSFSSDEMNEEYQKAVRFPITAETILSYVFIPVIIAFSIMFIGYSIKIVLFNAWPTNQIVRFVCIYSAIGIAVYIITAHIKNLFCELFRSFFPTMLVIFNLVAAVALYKRINYFGITYFRYFGILVIFFSVVIGVIYLIRKKVYLTATVILLCGMLAASSLPIVNFYDISCYSQMMRAQKILENNFMLESGILKPNTELTSYDMNELYNSVNYFSVRGKANLAPWLPSDFDISKFKKYFGFNQSGENDTGDFYYRTYILKDSNYSVDGYDMAIHTDTEYLDTGVVDSAEFEGKKGTYSYALVSDNVSGTISLILKLNGNNIITSDFSDFTNYIKEELKNELSTSQGVENNGLQTLLPYDKMSVELEGGGSRLLIVFNTVVDNRSTGLDSQKLDSLNVTASVYFDEKK